MIPFNQARNSTSRWMSRLSAVMWLGVAGILVSVPVLTSIPAALAQAVPAALQQAFTLLRQGRVQDAIAAFEQAVRRYPQSLEAKLGLAIAYRRQGLIPQAWQAYQNVLAQDPNNQLALKPLVYWALIARSGKYGALKHSPPC
jgi:Tfp pilus assembly protein PilF